jgi:O-antigen biosynthesis protein
VLDKDDQLRELNAELDRLRKSLVELCERLPSDTSTPAATDLINKQLRSIQSRVRLLQTTDTGLRARLERAIRETWELKVRRAEATARLNHREALLENIQRSPAWKAVKPFWKIFDRSRKPEKPAMQDDLVFHLDLPIDWKTKREILLIKGWCFSKSGREIVGVRAKIGRKGRLARYGLERPELAGSHPNRPLALESGFAIELPVPPGTSIVRLEAIEHGSDWELFFEHSLEREADGDSNAESTSAFCDSTTQFQTKEKLARFGPLSADKASETVRPLFQQHARQLVHEAKPRFTVLTPAHNTRPEWLAEAAVSLLNQSFANWEWCIADDDSQNRQTKKLLQNFASMSSRVQVKFLAAGGISNTLNEILDLAKGEYVCFLDHDDLLHPSALQWMLKKLEQGYDAVYSDEDKLDDKTGKLVEPFFKPDWSPEYFRGVMYVGHLLALRRDLAKKIRFDPAFDGIQDFEFMLRVSETGARIGHIPKILYHWRKTPGSIAAKPDAKPQIDLLQRKAVDAHLTRCHLQASSEGSNHPHRVRIVPKPRQAFPPVSIIIPTKDAPEMLERCLRSISTNTSYPELEVILLDNNTTDPRALELMQQFPTRRLTIPDPFNFSRANNRGAASAKGDFLVFLNNDTEILAADWLQHLLYYAEQPDIGAAGALLLYQDQTVQHAGVALGMRGTADHVMRGFANGGDGYAGSLTCAREVSALTAACLMIRKTLFDEIGGFNEHFFTAYQDVDLCLRLRARGLRLIYTPQAVAVHHESVSRKRYYDMIDRNLLLDRWEELIEQGDPYYNPNLNLERGDYSQNRA